MTADTIADFDARLFGKTGCLNCSSAGNLGSCNASLGTCTADLAICEAVPNGQVLKTGQTLCYDTTGSVIACTGTGQDGELQKGAARSFTDNGNGTITDNGTGLMWEKHSSDGSIHEGIGEISGHFEVSAPRPAPEFCVR